MNILGISCYYHDAAAALLQDGQLIAAAEEERFSRIKHDFGWPKLAIQFCLDSAGIKAADLDYAVFYEKPFRKFDRILMSVLQTYPQSYKVFRESMITWMIDKLWVGSKISAELGIPTEKILYAEHHMSHAASAFLCSPFEEAAILTVDGVGEWVTGTWGVGKGNQVEIKKQMMFPHSLGLLYSAFTAFLGFEVNEGEYKVMGMAPYGQPRYVEKVWKLIRQEADGSFSLDMDYFTYQFSTTRTFSKKFEQLFGAPRAPKTLFFTADSGFPTYFGEAPSNFKELCKENQHYADIAASIQQVTEEVLICMARQLHKETGMSKLCIAGGVGLNSVANHRILRETPFDDVFIQPAAGRRWRRTRRGAVGRQHAARQQAPLSHGSCLLGQSVLRRRDAEVPGRERHSVSADRGRRSPAGPGGRAVAAGKRYRLVPGPLRVGAARAGQSQHHRRCAESQHEGHRQHQDQVPRALSAICAVSAGRAHGRVLRAARRDGALSRALHAVRGAGAAVEALRRCRRSRTWTAPAVCRRSSRKRIRATTA